eukprot:6173741-Pleurochrysis_carterae.AAC.1
MLPSRDLFSHFICCLVTYLPSLSASSAPSPFTPFPPRLALSLALSNPLSLVPFLPLCAALSLCLACAGRRYPWGVALSEEGPIDHSELPKLRRFLLIDGLLSLKQARHVPSLTVLSRFLSLCTRLGSPLSCSSRPPLVPD